MVKEVSSCNVIYVDRRVRNERLISRRHLFGHATSPSSSSVSDGLAAEVDEVSTNTQALLAVFNQVNIIKSGTSCLTSISEISGFDPTPTVILIDIPVEQLEETYSEDGDRSNVSTPVQDQMLYGLTLLRHIKHEMEANSIPSNVMPVAFVTDSSKESGEVPRLSTDGSQWTASDDEETWCASRLLDLGAVDVLSSPISKQMTKGLSMQCYRVARAQQKSRGERKRSWVGVDADLEEEERERKSNVRVAEGYAYLREKMVSELMSDIFKPSGPKLSRSGSKIRVAGDRLETIKDAVGRWDFSAHDFDDDELLQCAYEMFAHSFTMPEVEEWRIPPGQLADFLYASRKAYNDQVPYHNFRHVVDVLQAVFYFLLSLGSLPHYTASETAPRPPKSQSLSSILRPFDALTLLIVAIGHDVGHPGVNNAFLITLKAPLAQMYNDRSVLESFHCAAFSQVLRKHWSSTQHTTEMRRLMIEAILATDMGLHFDYMGQLGKLKTKIEADGGISDWDEKTIVVNRSLLCTLLIKCADISNVARTYDTAVQWSCILTDEFSRQASLETDLRIPSSLAVSPSKDSSLALAKSQIGFMGLFAAPLFQAVADVMPEMSFGINEINANLTRWKALIEECTEKGDRPFIPVMTDRNKNPFANGQAPIVPSPVSSQATPRMTKAASEQNFSRVNGSYKMDQGSNHAPFHHSRKTSSGSHSEPSTPDSSDQQPVYTVLVTNHQSEANQNSTPRSPQSPRITNGELNGNGNAKNATSISPRSDSKPFTPCRDQPLRAAVSSSSLTAPDSADDLSESSPPPSIPEDGGPGQKKKSSSMALRHTRSRFNLQKIFRRKKSEAQQIGQGAPVAVGSGTPQGGSQTKVSAKADS